MRDKNNNIDPINPLDAHTKADTKVNISKRLFKFNVYGLFEYIATGMYYEGDCSSLNYYSCRGKGIPLPLEAFE
ncbi:hypothetical protein [uncultured Gammaproteobacteria bacterium]|nr:hypothetical protein [uncultured Gammaproteobacteria bacterium]